MSKTYGEIKFVLAENLPQKLKDISPVQKGLVAVKTSINSLPEYEIDSVGDSPTNYIQRLGREDNSLEIARVNLKRLKSEFEKHWCWYQKGQP